MRDSLQQATGRHKDTGQLYRLHLNPATGGICPWCGWEKQKGKDREKICTGGWTEAVSLQAYLSRCQQLGFRASPVPKFRCWRECDPYCIYVYILHFLISQRGEQDEAVGAFWICLSTGCFRSAVLWGWHRYVCSCVLYMCMCLCCCWKYMYMLSLMLSSIWSHGAVAAFLLLGCWIWHICYMHLHM